MAFICQKQCCALIMQRVERPPPTSLEAADTAYKSCLSPETSEGVSAKSESEGNKPSFNSQGGAPACSRLRPKNEDMSAGAAFGDRPALPRCPGPVVGGHPAPSGAVGVTLHEGIRGPLPSQPASPTAGLAEAPLGMSTPTPFRAQGLCS